MNKVLIVHRYIHTLNSIELATQKKRSQRIIIEKHGRKL